MDLICPLVAGAVVAALRTTVEPVGP